MCLDALGGEVCEENAGRVERGGGIGKDQLKGSAGVENDALHRRSAFNNSEAPSFLPTLTRLLARRNFVSAAAASAGVPPTCKVTRVFAERAPRLGFAKVSDKSMRAV
jgi:hypothetical protein